MCLDYKHLTLCSEKNDLVHKELKHILKDVSEGCGRKYHFPQLEVGLQIDLLIRDYDSQFKLQKSVLIKIHESALLLHIY